MNMPLPMEEWKQGLPGALGSAYRSRILMVAARLAWRLSPSA